MTPYQHLQLLKRFDRTFNLARIIERIVKPGFRVLDAGCGLGLLGQWAAQLGAEVLSVDLDDVSLARELATENGVADRMRFVQANLFDLVETEKGLANSFDVILAMVYLNDPRRDELQSQLAFQLKKMFLKPDGIMVPSHVSYSARLCEWPEQDYHSREAFMADDIDVLEKRYGMKFGSLRANLHESLVREWFPARGADGKVVRQSCRILSPMQEAFRVDYREEGMAIPESLVITADAAGFANVVEWEQLLMFDDSLLFRNESVSWIPMPVAVQSGSGLTVQLNDDWRRCNRIRVDD